VLAEPSVSLLRLVGLGLLVAGGLALVSRQRLSAAGVAAAGWYDRSRSGRRLAVRLDAAAIPLRPARWRAAQALLLPPAAIWGWTFTGSLLGGVSLASLLLRGGGGALLWVRRDRRDALLEDAAILIARHLATELGAGAAPSEVVNRMRGSSAMETRHVARVLVAGLAARLNAGQPLVDALSTVATCEPRGAGQAALARLATVAELATAGGAGTMPLVRFAEGMEARREWTSAARAVVAEVRMTAVAIPLLGVVVGVMLAYAEPSMAIAAFSLPLLSVVAACGVIAVAGSALVCRLTQL
jgi:tight adherence protein B